MKDTTTEGDAVAEYKITSTQLDGIGYYKVARNFLMFPRQGWHIRVDQKPVNARGDLSVPLLDAKGALSGAFGYIISSFHVKRENNVSFLGQVEGPLLGRKIAQEESKYVYFAYAGGGVWQPIWGYQKLVQKHKGEPVWTPDNTEIDAKTWSFACEKARWFVRELTRVTGFDHGLAMGPVQGAGARLFQQL
jgi:hypothetical protein